MLWPPQREILPRDSSTFILVFFNVLLMYGKYIFYQGQFQDINLRCLFLDFVGWCWAIYVVELYMSFRNSSSILFKARSLTTFLLIQLCFIHIALSQQISANGSIVLSARACAIRRREAIACKRFLNVACAMCRCAGVIETVSLCFIKT